MLALIALVSRVFLMISLLIQICSLTENGNGGWKLGDPGETLLLDNGICTIDRVSVLDLTPERFEREYRLQKPVLITFPNGASDWTDTSLWTEKHIRKEYARWKLKDGGLVRRDRNRTVLRTFVEYIDDVTRASLEPRYSGIKTIGELG